MAIREVSSTLPDREYIRALEEELRELRKMIERSTEIAKSALNARR